MPTRSLTLVSETLDASLPLQPKSVLLHPPHLCNWHHILWVALTLEIRPFYPLSQVQSPGRSCWLDLETYLEADRLSLSSLPTPGPAGAILHPEGP